MSKKAFGVVVSTIGRAEELDRLLHSLLGQEDCEIVVSIATQGNHDAVRAVVDRIRAGSEMTVHYIAQGAVGVSAGRNAAEQAITEPVDYLLFPNDTSLFPQHLLRRLNARLVGATAAALSVTEGSTMKFHLPKESEKLDKLTAWSVVSPGLVIDRHTFRVLGGFDEGLGTGADTPWQSGEETDLVLRYLDSFGGAGFRWIPDLHVIGRPDSAGLSVFERRRKLRAYARGYGALLRRHRYGLVRQLRALVAAATFGIRHRDEFHPLDGWWVFLGRSEGLLGRTVSRQPGSAVDR